MVDGWMLALERFIYPPCCVLCADRGCGRDLCAGCAQDLPLNEPACPRCAHPLSSWMPCAACLERPPPWDSAFSLLRYDYPADALIKAFKYGRRVAIGRVLGGLMADALVLRPRPELIVPVPLHVTRECERGFNQARELARTLAARLGIRLEARLCRRPVATPPQSGLDRRARRHNLRGAFALRGRLEGEHIAIVDDVITTGATATELARKLRRGGAGRIEIWSAARAAR